MTETTQTLDLAETDDKKFEDNLKNIDFNKKVNLNNNFELKKGDTKNNERIKKILNELNSNESIIDNLIDRIQKSDKNKDKIKDSIFYYIIKFKQGEGRINKDEFETLGEYSEDGKLKIPNINDEDNIKQMNNILRQIMYGLKNN